jgi:Short repeat of unknown function (DUF308)
VIARLSSHWWLFLIRGILAIVLAFAALAFPGAALLAVAVLFGAYAFVDGVVAIGTATRISHSDGRWGWLLFEGIIGILAGVFVFFYPFATVFALAFWVGALGRSSPGFWRSPPPSMPAATSRKSGYGCSPGSPRSSSGSPSFSCRRSDCSASSIC